MCEDVKAFMEAMGKKGIACSPVQEERWGSLTQVTLPGGGKLGVYQPKHGRSASAASKASTRKAKPKRTKRSR